MLGYPLTDAVERLAQEGVAVQIVEVRCKKGVPSGDEPRVIRQAETGAGKATLCYSVFQTEPNETNGRAFPMGSTGLNSVFQTEPNETNG